jgi:dihydroorotate dehydrogenase
MAVWYSLADSVLSRLDAETAHGLAIRILRSGLTPGDRRADPPSLGVKIWGRSLPNPIGLAAGFDKNAEVADAALALGFGLVEIGSVTPRPQEGNPRPRLFRLPEDRGVINRMGFPGHGLEAARARLAARPRRGFVGVNVGANKDSTDRAADYVTGCVALAPYADYLVCNVSSPNTPGLRSLQGRTELAGLLKRVQDAIAAAGPSAAPGPVPLVVKIAPDATDDDLDDIVFVCRDLRLDGIIVGNTTLSRPASLRSDRKAETGGLSGAPLTALSTEVLRKTAQRAERQFPLIGCGGVGSGADAYAKIRAGATLVQLYSAMVYEGPPLVRRIKDELAILLARDGFASVDDAVGADLR